MATGKWAKIYARKIPITHENLLSKSPQTIPQHDILYLSWTSIGMQLSLQGVMD